LFSLHGLLLGFQTITKISLKYIKKNSDAVKMTKTLIKYELI